PGGPGPRAHAAPPLPPPPAQAHVAPEDRALPIRTSWLRAAVALLGGEREGPVEDGERQGHEEEHADEARRTRRRKGLADGVGRERVAEAHGRREVRGPRIG